MAVHWSFAAYPKREVPIMVHNEDLGDFDNNNTIEPMSNMFINHHLKSFFPVVSKLVFIPTIYHQTQAYIIVYRLYNIHCNNLYFNISEHKIGNNKVIYFIFYLKLFLCNKKVEKT